MTRRACSLFAAALALTATGCIMPFNGPNGIRKDVQLATGREYDKAFALTLGRSGMALVRWAVEEAEDEDLPPLKGLRKVEIGMYEVRPGHGGPDGGSEVTASLWPGMSPMVEMYPESGESILILSEPGRDGSIKRLLFVVDNDDELIIVRLKGDLEEFVEEAIRYAFEQAERPDLAEPSIEEYLEGRVDSRES